MNQIISIHYSKLIDLRSLRWTMIQVSPDSRSIFGWSTLHHRLHSDSKAFEQRSQGFSRSKNVDPHFQSWIKKVEGQFRALGSKYVKLGKPTLFLKDVVHDHFSMKVDFLIYTLLKMENCARSPPNQLWTWHFLSVFIFKVWNRLALDAKTPVIRSGM